MNKTTESSSEYDNLELFNTQELVKAMNDEDQKVAQAVKQASPQITAAIDAIFPALEQGGRLFYVGAGTSGRLGIVDASECPPTFGVPHEMVQGIIAGGDSAIRKAVEGAEDSRSLPIEDLKAKSFSAKDSVVGIAASGTTPYVLSAIEYAQELGAVTACITCNAGSPLAQLSEFPIEVVCGPEFITGSTRLKAGTATKMVLNMLSTCLMIKLGRVKGNKMVDMQLSNDKLVDRGSKMVSEATGLSYGASKDLLLRTGSVRNAIKEYNANHA